MCNCNKFDASSPFIQPNETPFEHLKRISEIINSDNVDIMEYVEFGNTCCKKENTNSLFEINDPKYAINSDYKIVNVETLVPIPDDEPVLILRAKDVLAIEAIRHYLECVKNNDLDIADAIKLRISDFLTFAENQSDKMKFPD